MAKPVTLIPILGAGLAMCAGILNLITHAHVGHLGLYRDNESLEPVEYYKEFHPDFKKTEIIVIDPMLAGGSTSAALNFIKKEGGIHLTFVYLVASPEGVKLFEEHHPDVPVYTAALGRQLTNHGYILPD